jgi:hypothetical protein
MYTLNSTDNLHGKKLDRHMSAKSTPASLARTVMTPLRFSPVRGVLREQLRIDGHKVVSHDRDHGESSKAVGQSVQSIMCDHLRNENNPVQCNWPVGKGIKRRTVLFG